MQRFVFISVYRAVLLPPSPQDTHSLHTYITRIWQQHGNNGAHIRTNAYTSAPALSRIPLCMEWRKSPKSLFEKVWAELCELWHLKKIPHGIITKHAVYWQIILLHTSLQAFVHSTGHLFCFSTLHCKNLGVIHMGGLSTTRSRRMTCIRESFGLNKRLWGKRASMFRSFIYSSIHQ